MIQKYSFRTSLGWVEIEFDPTRFVPQLVRGKDLHNRTIDCIKHFVWVRGKEFIRQLYAVNLSDHKVYIVKELDNSLWFIVEVYDTFFGVPEYLLQE